MSIRIAAVSLVMVAAACSGHPTSSPSGVVAPTTPSAPPQGPPGFGPTSGPYQVTGVVLELTRQGTRPISDAGVNLWVDGGRYGYSYWWANGQVHSAADGSFQLPNLPAASGSLQAWKEGYVQQCAVPVLSLSSNPSVQLALVARANITVDPQSIPASMPGRIVSGRILENGPSGPQPVSGAYVDFESFMDYPAAMTYSDSDGRYLLCGVADGSIGVLGAGDRSAYAPVPRDQGLNVHLDIVLP